MRFLFNQPANVGTFIWAICHIAFLLHNACSESLSTEFPTAGCQARSKYGQQSFADGPPVAAVGENFVRLEILRPAKYLWQNKTELLWGQQYIRGWSLSIVKNTANFINKPKYGMTIDLWRDTLWEFVRAAVERCSSVLEWIACTTLSCQQFSISIVNRNTLRILDSDRDHSRIKNDNSLLSSHNFCEV